MTRDILTEFYENDAQRFWSPQDGMKGRDLTIYPLLKGLSGAILEYGPGSGSLLLSLALEGRFTRIFGVDISDFALSAMLNSWEKMRTIAGLGKKDIFLHKPINDQMPMIEDHSIDVILSLDTIEHVINPYTVIDEFYRIGKPGSVFIISVPNYGYIKYVLQLLRGKQPITGSDSPVSEWRHAGWDGYHLHTFTRESLDILLRDCGWTPVSWSGYGERGSRFGLGILRKRFPAFWSGALTVVCKRQDKLERTAVVDHAAA